MLSLSPICRRSPLLPWRRLDLPSRDWRRMPRALIVCRNMATVLYATPKSQTSALSKKRYFNFYCRHRSVSVVRRPDLTNVGLKCLTLTDLPRLDAQLALRSTCNSAAAVTAVPTFNRLPHQRVEDADSWRLTLTAGNSPK
jgi:hypothetical protein